jgi:hypothetical protein
MGKRFFSSSKLPDRSWDITIIIVVVVVVVVVFLTSQL